MIVGMKVQSIQLWNTNFRSANDIQFNHVRYHRIPNIDIASMRKHIFKLLLTKLRYDLSRIVIEPNMKLVRSTHQFPISS